MVHMGLCLVAVFSMSAAWALESRACVICSPCGCAWTDNGFYQCVVTIDSQGGCSCWQSDACVITGGGGEGGDLLPKRHGAVPSRADSRTQGVYLNAAVFAILGDGSQLMIRERDPRTAARGGWTLDDHARAVEAFSGSADLGLACALSGLLPGGARPRLVGTDGAEVEFLVQTTDAGPGLRVTMRPGGIAGGVSFEVVSGAGDVNVIPVAASGRTYWVSLSMAPATGRVALDEHHRLRHASFLTAARGFPRRTASDLAWEP